MTEGIPDEIVRALSAVGFVLFAENIAGEFSFERYSPVREAELMLVRQGDDTWLLKVTARAKDGPWEAIPLETTEVRPEDLNRDFLKRLIAVIDAGTATSAELRFHRRLR